MKIFASMYQYTVKLAQHKLAAYYLAALSFAESSFFPIPVDAMLAPMALAQPKKWWQFALLAAIFSVLGGILGYALGYWFWDLIQDLITQVGWLGLYDEVAARINREGLWILFIASFTPLPFKLATIAAGTLHMALGPFIVISLIGRAMRFFLVAALMAWFGQALEAKLMRYIEIIGWLCVLIFALFLWYHWFF